MYKFDSSVDNSKLSETQRYTTLIQAAPHETIVVYNRYYHPGNGVPGCTAEKAEVCSSAFAMRFRAVRKSSDSSD